MLKKKFAICFTILLLCSVLYAKEEYPFIGIVTHDNINVRAGANINFEMLCKLIKDEKVAVVGKSYNWYKIILPKDAICYVNEKYIRTEEADSFIIANRVNIRARAGDNFSIIGQLNKGDRVKILKKSGQWYGIEPVEASFGWVHEKFLRYYSEFNKGIHNTPMTKELKPRAGSVKLSDSQAEVVNLDKTNQGQQKQSVDNLVSAVGIIEPMGRVFNRAGSHKLISDGKIAFILSGDRSKLDSFIKYRVKVVGNSISNASSKYPVINVKQITACE